MAPEGPWTKRLRSYIAPGDDAVARPFSAVLKANVRNVRALPDASDDEDDVEDDVDSDDEVLAMLVGDPEHIADETWDLLECVDT